MDTREPLWSYPHFRIYLVSATPPPRNPGPSFLLVLAYFEMAVLGYWSILFFICIGAYLFIFALAYITPNFALDEIVCVGTGL